MYRWPRPRKVRGGFYQGVTSLDALMSFFSARPGAFDGLADDAVSFDGRCYICQSNVSFEISRLDHEDQPNWRETLVCPQCGLSNRQRSCIHLFDTLVDPEPDDWVYLTEAVTPLSDELRKRDFGLCCSEFSSDVAPGDVFETPYGPVRNQDVTALQMLDRQYHAVLSFDVLEHLPDFRAALKEFHRILATGGQLILSVPFLFGEHTRTMAKLDAQGQVKHLCEPVYHGDPVSEEGVLCFYEFGMDLLDDMKAAGFRNSFAVVFNAPEWGYLTAQILFVGRKRS